MNRYSQLWPLAALLISAAAASAQQLPPTLVETEPVTKQQFNNQVTLVGRTEAATHSQIVAEVAGMVTAINAGEGVLVPAGEKIVTIDSDKISLQHKSKQAEAELAKEEAELAATNYKRAQELYNKSLISEGGLDSASTWANMKQHDYERLEADAEQLAIDLQHTSIEAPYTGYTIRKLVDVGGWVNPGTPVFEMVDLSKIKVTVDLPERYFGHLNVGSPVSIVVSNDESHPLKGKVTGIAPSAVQETHTFPVIITVKNDEGRLAGGMLVQTTVSLKEEFVSLAVSKDAIVRQGANTIVYTIADGKAAPIPVVTGSTEGSKVSVKGDGLQEGMPVVVRGNERIFPGSPVRTPDSDQGGQSSNKEG